MFFFVALLPIFMLFLWYNSGFQTFFHFYVCLFWCFLIFEELFLWVLWRDAWWGFRMNPYYGIYAVWESAALQKLWIATSFALFHGKYWIPLEQESNSQLKIQKFPSDLFRFLPTERIFFFSPIHKINVHTFPWA